MRKCIDIYKFKQRKFVYKNLLLKKKDYYDEFYIHKMTLIRLSLSNRQWNIFLKEIL